MGKFNVSMRVGDLAKSSLAEVEALADTGSIQSYVPRDVLDEVNVLPIKTRPFALADERVVEMEFGCATFVLQSMEVIAPAIFAEEGSSPILGVTTLEAAHFATGSVNEGLTPVLPLGWFGNGSQSASR